MRVWWTAAVAAAVVLGGCGGEEEIGSGGGQLQATWGQVRSEVFPSCSSAGCHADASPDSGGVLIRPEDEYADEVYANLVDAKVADVPGRGTPEVEFRVVPGSPEASYLYWKVLGHAPGDPDTPVSGLPMPHTCSKPPCLDEARIELIRAWIAGGAKR